MSNFQFGLTCLAIAALMANIVNISQTSQIGELKSRTKNLEAALAAYNIPMPVEK